MKQATFGEYKANTPDFPGVSRDEYGPTMRRPVPERDAIRTVDDLRMRARGFDPDGLRDEAAGNRPAYHRDDADRHREIDDREHREATNEQPITPTMQPNSDGTAAEVEFPTMGEIKAVRKPSSLFDESPFSEARGLEWGDVDTPDGVPETADAAVIGFGKHLLLMGGVRTGFGHHEEVRRSMEAWAPGRDDPDPTDRRQRVFSITTDGRHFGRFKGDDDERRAKAELVISWASDEYPAEVFADGFEEYQRRIRDKWESSIDDARRDACDRNFAEHPPAELNGWERFEPELAGARLAYRGRSHGTDSVAVVYEREDGELDAKACLLEEYREAETAAGAKANRHLGRPSTDRTAFGCLRSHLTSFDAEPVGSDDGARGTTRAVADGGAPPLQAFDAPGQIEGFGRTIQNAGRLQYEPADGEPRGVRAFIEREESSDGRTLYFARYRAPSEVAGPSCRDTFGYGTPEQAFEQLAELIEAAAERLGGGA